MISVITLTYNNFNELRVTLDSLEPLNNIESIIINGGTCSATKKFLNNFKGKHRSGPDNGISDAFNKGLQLSTKNAITFLNSGDKLIDPDYYSYALDILEQSSDLDFVYADIILNDAFSGKLHITSGRDLPDMTYLHPTLIVKKNVFNKIGAFDTRLKSAMDLDLIYRFKKNHLKGHYYNRPVVEMNGEGISSKNDVLFLKEKVFVVFKNKDFRLTTIFTLARLMINFCIRRALIFLGLTKIIGLYRRQKHQ